MKQVKIKTDEINESEFHKKTYLENIDKRRRALKKLSHVQCSTNFLKHNVDNSKNFEIYLENQAFTRAQKGEMIEEAREKRDKIRHLKVARYQFD